MRQRARVGRAERQAVGGLVVGAVGEQGRTVILCFLFVLASVTP
jgi:hypothetical protein